MKTSRTIVGNVNQGVLAFTVGQDPVLDRALVEADCLGSIAHVRMLAAMPLTPPLFTPAQCQRVVAQLVRILREARTGRFKISVRDQDVHMAVERVLTERLGDLGKRVHTARSRNDQVAVDLRLFAKRCLLDLTDDIRSMAEALLALAGRHRMTPMVGRTHLQPAMPSTVGMWASAYAENLLETQGLMKAAYEVNDRCPLGSAAGFGVPLPIDRAGVARALGFREPIHNVWHASNMRGQCESAILAGLSHVMLVLARLAEDLIFYSVPELGYFRLPPEYCTGSSIMPQKRNPDVLELIRAKAVRVKSCQDCVYGITSRLPGGYHRDLQETKAPFMDGLETSAQCIRMMREVVARMEVDVQALARGFHAGVFATDRALALVMQGIPFRQAYQQVKQETDAAGIPVSDPRVAVRLKTHLGGTAGLDLNLLKKRWAQVRRETVRERKFFFGALSRLLGQPYP